MRNALILGIKRTLDITSFLFNLPQLGKTTSLFFLKKKCVYKQKSAVEQQHLIV